MKWSSIKLVALSLLVPVLITACNPTEKVDVTVVSNLEEGVDVTVVTNQEELVNTYTTDFGGEVYTIDLKPCCFCNSTNLRVFVGDLLGNESDIECKDCGAKTDLFKCCTIERAINESTYCWNNRIDIQGYYRGE